MGLPSVDLDRVLPTLGKLRSIQIMKLYGLGLKFLDLCALSVTSALDRVRLQQHYRSVRVKMSVWATVSQ
jgi:hypothetical protein